MKEIGYTQIVSVGCGVDVRQDVIVASIYRKRSNGCEIETREYETDACSFESLREWCKLEAVSHIAINCAEMYRKPVFDMLSEDFEMILVDACHSRNVREHINRKDRHWLSKLLLSGLLKGSQVPARDIRELRDLVRYFINNAESKD